MNLYLFNLIHSLSDNNFINYFCLFLSYIFVYLLPIFLIIWIFYTQKRKIYSFSILFFSALSTWLITGLIKILTAIGRPITLNPMIIEKSFSFPSGHSSVMMTVAVVAYSLNKKLGIFLFIMAILVGFSRIILGVHFPIDVLIGWLLGGVVGYIFIRIFKKI